MSRFAFSWAESSYTVGFIWGRPRLRKPRLEPHSPARNRPARRCAAESRDPARVTRLMPSLSCAIPPVAVRKPCVKRFRSGGARRLRAPGAAAGARRARPRGGAEWRGGGGLAARADLIPAAPPRAAAAAAVAGRREGARPLFFSSGPGGAPLPADPYEGTLL